MKKVNLAKALTKNKGCLGFIWRFSNGRYGYQNDNDLGLDVDELNCETIYVKKIYFTKKDYAYQIRGGFMDDGTGVGYKTVLALLKECHEFYLPLTKHEKMLTTRYWNQF